MRALTLHDFRRPDPRPQRSFAHEGRDREDWLFTNRSGGPIFYKATRWRLVAALDAAGLPRGGLHMLRSTAATLSLQQGTSVRDVQNLLGHASPLMTLTRYATVDVTSQTAGSAKVAEAILSAGTRPNSGHTAEGATTAQ